MKNGRGCGTSRRGCCVGARGCCIGAQAAADDAAASVAPAARAGEDDMPLRREGSARQVMLLGRGSCGDRGEGVGDGAEGGGGDCEDCAIVARGEDFVGGGGYRGDFCGGA